MVATTAVATTTALPATYLNIFCSNFFIIYPIDLGFFLFERKQNYLQEDIKLSIIGQVLPEKIKVVS
jgi:hypothetical protein